MRTTDPLDPESELEEIAARWLIERDEGFAPDRAKAFAEWCKRDSRHAEAVARVASALALLDELPAVRASLETRVGRNTAQESRSVSLPRVAPLGRWPWVAGLAAVLLLGAIAWWNRPVTVPLPQDYAANTAEPHRVALSDGSVVDLNVNSRLQVQFAKGERRITLSAGEAHFQVAPDKTRPFIVTANDVAVRAVGTAFNVRLLGERVEILVTEGKVEVNREDTRSSGTSTILPLLEAGERALISAGLDQTPRVEEVAPAAAHLLLAWQDKMTSFVDVPLREMIARINRCNRTQLVLQDPELGDRKIGGVIALSQVDAFVHLLEQDGDIVAERRAGGEIILRRAR